MIVMGSEGVELTHDDLVDHHPGGNRGEADAENLQLIPALGRHESQQHDGEPAEKKLRQAQFDRRARVVRVHTHVVVDGIHFVDAVEALRLLVHVLVLVQDRIVARGDLTHVGLQGFYIVVPLPTAVQPRYAASGGMRMPSGKASLG